MILKLKEETVGIGAVIKVSFITPTHKAPKMDSLRNAVCFVRHEVLKYYEGSINGFLKVSYKKYIPNELFVNCYNIEIKF